MNDDIPRRIRIDLLTPAELAVRDAQLAVETIGCDDRLTEAVVLIGRARTLVADVVEGKPTVDGENHFWHIYALLDPETLAVKRVAICGGSYMKDPQGALTRVTGEPMVVVKSAQGRTAEECLEALYDWYSYKHCPERAIAERFPWSTFSSMEWRTRAEVAGA